MESKKTKPVCTWHPCSPLIWPGLRRHRSWWCRSPPPRPAHWPWPASPPGSSWSWTASSHPPGMIVSLIECVSYGLEAGDMCKRICETEQIMTDGINKSLECGQTIINVFHTIRNAQSVNVSYRDSQSLICFLTFLTAQHTNMLARKKGWENEWLTLFSQCFTQININVGRTAAITIITTGATKRKLEQFINVGDWEKGGRDTVVVDWNWLFCVLCCVWKLLV